MKFSSYLKALVAVSLFVIFSILLTGCAPKKVEVHESDISGEGVVLEDYLPEDTMMMYSINTRDKSQKEKLDNLISYFPNEDMDKFFEDLIKEATLELSEVGLSYKEDIEPIFSDSFKMVFGIAGNFEEKAQNDEEPDMYVAFTIADTEKAKNIIDLIAENEDFEKGEVFEAITLDNEKEDMYFAMYKDTALLTPTADLRHQALKRMKNNENSLRSNENFIKSYEKLPKPNISTIYISIEGLAHNLAQLGEEDEDVLVMQPILDAIFSEMIAVVAEDEGLKMVIQVAFNPKAEEFNFNDFPYEEPYLYKTIPGDDLIIYAEAYGLKEVVDLEKQIFLADEDAQKDFRKFELLMKKTTGLDLQEDVLSWMDKGYALALQSNEGIVPGISIYIDAETNTEGANELITLIDAAITEALDGIKAQAPEDAPVDEIFKKELVNIGESEINRLTIDFTGLSEEELEEAGIPEGVFTQPIELYYGLTAQNYFILSTYYGLANNYGTMGSVADNPVIKDAHSYIKDYPYQLSYISVEEAVKYVDTFIGVMETVEGPLPDDVREGYDKVKSYLAPIKYLVGGNKKVENIAEGLMFIKLEPVPVIVE